MTSVTGAMLYQRATRTTVAVPTVRLPIPLVAQPQREFMRRTPRHRISYDGRKIVFSAENKLWVKRLDTGNEYELPDTEGGMSPFWSPDSSQIGFFQ